mgnify:CR=1 FL=1
MTDAINLKINQEPIKKKSQFLEVLKRLSYNKGAVFGGILFLAVLLLAVFAPVIAPYDYAAINIKDRFMSPCLSHLFGTDHMGRDIFSRVLFGARYSLLIGIGSVISVHFLESSSEQFPDIMADGPIIWIMRICDIIQSIPGLILNIALACVLGPGCIQYDPRTWIRRYCRNCQADAVIHS